MVLEGSRVGAVQTLVRVAQLGAGERVVLAALQPWRCVHLLVVVDPQQARSASLTLNMAAFSMTSDVGSLGWWSANHAAICLQVLGFRNAIG